MLLLVLNSSIKHTCNQLHFVYSGLHLAVIHSQMDLLDRLLYLMTKEPMLQGVVDEQNAMYQVCVAMYVCVLIMGMKLCVCAVRILSYFHLKR